MSPKELARVFSNYNTDELVEFFNEVGNIKHVKLKADVKYEALKLICRAELSDYARLVLNSYAQHYRRQIDPKEDVKLYHE